MYDVNFAFINKVSDFFSDRGNLYRFIYVCTNLLKYMNIHLLLSQFAGELCQQNAPKSKKIALSITNRMFASLILNSLLEIHD